MDALSLDYAVQPPPAFTPQVTPEMSWLTFGSAGVSINTMTGEVRVQPGVTHDDAARGFWNAVARLRGQHEPFPPVAQGATP